MLSWMPITEENSSSTTSFAAHHPFRDDVISKNSGHTQANQGPSQELIACPVLQNCCHTPTVVLGKQHTSLSKLSWKATSCEIAAVLCSNIMLC